eukprot:TRINITY_DN2931_c0_g1_i3.p1 TRINITY_DN2931_c0_g1~~TRINITY_DN2931_c0_g1_i3.p1  ORF type:complete len:153 (+),score=39.85 TRINITY_DN2931_c0_g1_i3:207-665(+)
MRNKLQYLTFLRKRMNTNPQKGPYHYRAPSRMVWRVIRGMVPHKTARGAAALDRLKCFDGVPTPYDKVKRVVIPSALAAARLAPARKVTTLKRLAMEVGWHYGEVVDSLEQRRKDRSEAYHTLHKKENALRLEAMKKVDEQEPELAAIIKSF